MEPNKREIVKGSDGAQLEASLKDDIFNSAFSGHNVSSAIDKLVTQGKEVEDMFLRTDFPDINYMLDFVSLYGEALDSDDEELRLRLLNILSGLPAILGKRIHQLIEAVVGQIDNDNHKKHQGFLDKIGLGDKKADGGNNGVK